MSWGRSETEGSLSSLASIPSLVGELWASERPCLTGVLKMAHLRPSCGSHSHACAPACASHTNWHTLTHAVFKCLAGGKAQPLGGALAALAEDPKFGS